MLTVELLYCAWHLIPLLIARRRTARRLVRLAHQDVEVAVMRSWYARAMIGLTLALLGTAIPLLCITPPRAEARTNNTGDAFVVTSSPTQLPYGAELDVTVRVTIAAVPTTVGYYFDLYPQFDGGAAITPPFQGLISNLSPVPYVDDTLRFTSPYVGHPMLAGGNHTLTITWQDHDAPYAVRGTVQTQFTVTPTSLPAFSCTVVNGNDGAFFGVGKTVPIALDFGNVPLNMVVDWQDAKYDVTLTGPTTVTYTDLTPTTTQRLEITAPPQNGVYSYQCWFKGTPSFNKASSTITGGLTISLMRPLGSVQLYTNPTTLVTGQRVDMEVVFHAAAGGPMPDRYFFIDLIGASYFYTSAISMPPGGEMLVHLGPLPNLNYVTNVRVDYSGDTYYAPAGILFPLTNPPISGMSGGSGGGRSASPTATTAPSPTATGATALPTTTPQNTDPNRVFTAGKPWYLGSNALWWVVLAALAVFGGVGGGAVWWQQRGKPNSSVRAPEVPAARAKEPAEAGPPPPDAPM
jgi:hypothetical protein